MRVLFGWLLLFGLAATAGWGTARWRAKARDRSDSLTNISEVESFGSPADIFIGAPSKSDPIEQLYAPESAPLREVDITAPEPWNDPTPPQSAPPELTVRPGDTLSVICQNFYDEPDRPPLAKIVKAVAQWNGLESPNDLQVEQVLELPTLEELEPLLPR